MHAILIVAGLAALIWGVMFSLRGGLLAGALMVLLAGTCFGFPFFHLSGGPLPLTADRFLWAVLMAQYVVWRARGWADAKPPGKSEWLLIALVGVMFLSTLTHDWSIRGNQPAAWLVFFYLMPVGLYWVVREAKASERAVLALFGGLALFGLYLSVTAFAETRQWWSVVFPRYIASREYPEFFGRGRGPLLNPAGLGFVLSLCCSSMLLFWPRVGRGGKAAIVLFSLIYAAGVYATLTRCAWIGAAGGLLIVVGLSVPRTWRAPLLAGTCLMVMVLGVTQWEHFMAFKRDKGLSEQETAESAKLRPILAMVAWKMFLDRPLLGCGFGHYRDEFVYYLDDRSTDLPLEKARPYVQHNVFLALLAEIGLIGMGLFIAMLSLWSRDAWRLWRAAEAPLWARQQGLLFLAMLGSYIPNAMFHDLSIIPMVNMFLFFMAGLTSSLSWHAQSATAAQPVPAPVSTVARRGGGYASA